MSDAEISQDDERDEFRSDDTEEDSDEDQSGGEEAITDVITLSVARQFCIETKIIMVPSFKTVSSLVKSLCRKLVKRMRRTDYHPDNHMWTLRIGDTIDDGFKCGVVFRRERFSNSRKFASVPESERDPKLSSLRLMVGCRLSFEYDYGDTCAFLINVAHIGAPPAPGTGAAPVDPPLLSAAEVAQSREARRLAARNIPSQAVPWSDDEKRLLYLLIVAGLPYSRAWDRFLECALLCRTHGATSGAGLTARLPPVSCFSAPALGPFLNGVECEELLKIICYRISISISISISRIISLLFSVFRHHQLLPFPGPRLAKAVRPTPALLQHSGTR